MHMVCHLFSSVRCVKGQWAEPQLLGGGNREGAFKLVLGAKPVHWGVVALIKLILTGWAFRGVIHAISQFDSLLTISPQIFRDCNIGVVTLVCVENALKIKAVMFLSKEEVSHLQHPWDSLAINIWSSYKLQCVEWGPMTVQREASSMSFSVR